MSKKIFNVTLKLVRDDKLMRSEQYTNDCVAALIEQVKDYVRIFKVKPDEYKGGTLISINSDGHRQIGIIAHDGSLILEEPGTGCIYCQKTPVGTPVYDEDGCCSICTNKVTIQTK